VGGGRERRCTIDRRVRQSGHDSAAGGRGLAIVLRLQLEIFTRTHGFTLGYRVWPPGPSSDLALGSPNAGHSHYTARWAPDPRLLICPGRDFSRSVVAGRSAGA